MFPDVNPASSPALSELIRDEIRSRGPVSFAWFMDQALYHPTQGYYSTGRAVLGRKGDYFTNVSVGPLFGKLLAAQFGEMWEQLGKPEHFVIVEQGAHSGAFAQDALQAMQIGWPEFFQHVHYRIVEPFAALREQQSRALSEFGARVDWPASVEALAPFTGIHFSNELLDAMPVHLIGSPALAPGTNERAQPDWDELCVGLDGDRFVFVHQPIVEPELEQHVKRIAGALPSRPAKQENAPAYQTEVNLEALRWIDRISTRLERGFVLTVDYGFARPDFYASHRTAGTLQCRARHHRIASPFSEIGNCDISAHVEWTSLVERAQERKFLLTGFADQHHFLTGIISQWPQLLDPADAKSRRALQTLLHPEMLGRSFQVLALARNVDPTLPLAGFKFGRDPRAALGLWADS